MTQPAKSYLLIGHVTRDLQPEGGFTIGGTVTYGAMVAKQLGWQPTIVTTAAADFEPPAHLAEVDWRILPSPVTTTFRNQYDAHGNRHQTIGPVAGAIEPVDLPADCRRAELVHFCPLAQELPATLPAAFGQQAWLAATPQGWLRSWDETGRVSLGDWPEASNILPQLQAAVISIEDVQGDWSVAERWATHLPVLVVTQGEQGCTVFYRGQRQAVPPRPAQPVDLTGAGDIFAVSFFIRLYERGQVWPAARFANVLASLALERSQPQSMPTLAEVEQYLADHPA
jgi:sugar/nucleoside kinase (ribokinase family)